VAQDLVFVIAECGSSWRFGNDHLSNAYRMIEAAKECGADAVKFQWTSDYKLMMARRGASPAEEFAYTFVQYDRKWLPLLKAHADKVGIQFGCTAFLREDFTTVAKYSDFLKVAAKESTWRDFVELNIKRRNGRRVIVSRNVRDQDGGGFDWETEGVENLWCVSKYPASLEAMRLCSGIAEITDTDHEYYPIHGLSDHTGHVLTGAVAVGAGARVIEAHVRLHDTPVDNPDYPHSHELNSVDCDFCDRPTGNFKTYVQNVRIAERMM
jgi:pseudaminic acid synthase